MTRDELAKPDNEADVMIALSVSGNRLVSVLNCLDQLLFQAGHMKFKGNDVEMSSPWYSSLHATTEAMRDALSEQRMAARR